MLEVQLSNCIVCFISLVGILSLIYFQGYSFILRPMFGLCMFFEQFSLGVLGYVQIAGTITILIEKFC